MKRIGYIIAILLFGGLLIYIPWQFNRFKFVEKQNTALQIVTPTITSNAHDEFPPLYPDIAWNQPNSGDYVLKTGYRSTPSRADIEQFGQSATNFFYVISSSFDTSKISALNSYYANWFKSRGWKDNIASGGPTGSIIGYTNNGKVFLYQYVFSTQQGFAQVIIEHN